LLVGIHEELKLGRIDGRHFLEGGESLGHHVFDGLVLLDLQINVSDEIILDLDGHDNMRTSP